MLPPLSLAQLVALPLTPPDMVQLAADAGCAGVGLRLLPASPGGLHHPLMEQPGPLRETLARMRDTGVRVLDLEVVRLGEQTDLARFLPFLDLGQQLGAAHVLVAGDDPDEARLTARYAGFCDLARRFGLSADLEFMPWTQVPDLPCAQRIVAAADRPNGAVLIDALHFARSASHLDHLDGWPRARMNYAQICDGPVPGPDTVEGLIHAARSERLLPGEGAIDLTALFARLPADLPVSIEVPSESRAPQLGWLTWARMAVAATRAALERADAAREDLATPPGS
jgi:sugar phosphate isomerase/epimerase